MYRYIFFFFYLNHIDGNVLGITDMLTPTSDYYCTMVLGIEQFPATSPPLPVASSALEPTWTSSDLEVVSQVTAQVSTSISLCALLTLL